jgi:iron complex transport system permease protein
MSRITKKTIIAGPKLQLMFVKNPFQWILLLLALLILFVLDLTIGSVSIPINEILYVLFGGDTTQPVWRDIILDFRLTKAFTCVFAGGALALGGLQMQTLFRNPLAGPDVLGLSSGASLAVSLIFMSNAAGFTWIETQSPWAVAIAASAGCFSVFLIMIAVSRRIQDNVSLLIVGLMVAATTSSIVSVLQYLSAADEMQVYIIWTFGSLGSLNWFELRVLALLLLMGFAIAFLNVKSLNAWMLGDNYAKSLGIDIKRSRFFIILSGSILTGAVTAFCGPIAFVGLAVPHLVKLIINSNNHKTLIPAVTIGGAILLLGCDILSHIPGQSTVLPVNAITALIGAPVVIWVILKNRIVRA